MKRVALVFILAVILPSLVLAWLAVRSLRDQEYLLERQQSLLYQGVADGLAREVQSSLGDDLQQFRAQVTSFLSEGEPRSVAVSFDERLRQQWSLAQVGFVVTGRGEILSPPPSGRPEARKFLDDNKGFLGNLESAAVFLNAPGSDNNSASPVKGSKYAPGRFQNSAAPPSLSSLAGAKQSAEGNRFASRYGNRDNSAKDALTRNVMPQQQLLQADAPAAKSAANAEERLYSPQPLKAPPSPQSPQELQQPRSRLALSEGEFRQLIGEQPEGMLARFVDNKLAVLFWVKAPQDPDLVFGAQLDLAKLKEGLSTLVKSPEGQGGGGEASAGDFGEDGQAGRLPYVGGALGSEVCMVLLDDNARPAATSHPGFQTNWKRPFVATEIGEALPHWEAAVYLLNPAALAQSARTVKLTLGLLIAVLVSAIGAGSWLIVADLNRQLLLARQKTDFVSNVSHELKTPLTSIRMFSELLAEGRVSDQAKQRSYLGIIVAETARLSRLINNVLDFARSERGEKQYSLQRCDVAQLTRELIETCRPRLEAAGFKFECAIPEWPCWVKGDRDALAQVLLNLLSNAEKYSGERKEITITLSISEQASEADGRGGRGQAGRLPYSVELRVLDRGVGVPAGCEKKIFDKFYRAHDSLSSGIQGSGLGLTLARQIARAHGGEVLYQPREGGGSCFILRVPGEAEVEREDRD